MSVWVGGRLGYVQAQKLEVRMKRRAILRLTFALASAGSLLLVGLAGLAGLSVAASC